MAAAILPVTAAPALAQQEVILVRHAELPGTAMADPKSMPLSAEGKARAQRLAGMLKDSGIAAIYVTDFARTNQTAQPLASEIGRMPTVVPKGNPLELVERMRRENAGQVVLLVGHTDTLPGLITALGVPLDVKIDAQDYSNIFVVTPKSQGASGFLRLHY
jgi:broad specificity phosphatase PhoE